MNPLNWPVSTQVVTAAGIVSALGVLWSVIPAIADSIPYATRAYVEAQFQFQQQTRSYDRRDELDFQITQEKSQQYGLEAQPSQNTDTAKLIEKLKADVDKKQREYDLLDCQLKFVITHITCTQSP